MRKHVVKCNGWIVWERPPTSDLWKRPDIVSLLPYMGAKSVDVSTAALGVTFRVRNGFEYVN